VQKFTARLSGAPHDQFSILSRLGFMRFTQERRQDVRCFQIEIVVGTVKIRGHHRNEIRAVLASIRLAKLNPGNLRKRVSFISRLQRSA
jgi:hypothetical protein